MKNHKYSVNQHLIETILSWVKSGEIAIPEIQRSFVWNSTKVRDLLDSLYKGYPIGYLIAWKNPNVKLKDGTSSEGKKVLIDGQQRVAALAAAILGKDVINSDYKRVKVKIAFNPKNESFEVWNTAIAKDSGWIADISPVVSGEKRLTELLREYCEKNPDANEIKIERAIENLREIIQKQIGIIELSHDLDIEVVTEIFIRINSKGTILNQADFAMSKMASNETYGGNVLRKCIDYFCHLARTSEFYSQIADVDKEFTETTYFQKMAWLKDENNELYKPTYVDLLRVAFTSEFNRGELSNLVSLLSGRNFETRSFEEEIAEKSFATLKSGILKFINETNFKRFVMIIKSAGFIITSQIRSKNVLNFAYILYLKLREKGENQARIESFVRRWFVLSVLTGRYSSSPASAFDLDVKNIHNRDFYVYLKDVEESVLSDAFWNATLIQGMDTPVASSPYFHVYLASQVKMNNLGFLSKDIAVNELIMHRGDIHHIFPRAYLRKSGFKKKQYNQIANYVYMQSEINIKIGSKAPRAYFREIIEQCNGGAVQYGGITDMESLKTNLKENCIPESVFDMEKEDYETFLSERRKLIAHKLKEYYFSL